MSYMILLLLSLRVLANFLPMEYCTGSDHTPKETGMSNLLCRFFILNTIFRAGYIYYGSFFVILVHHIMGSVSL